MQAKRHFYTSTLLCFLFLTSFILVNKASAEEASSSIFSSDPIYEIKAGIGSSLEYNDNIDNVSANPQSSFIYHLRPTFSFQREGGRITANINYIGDYSFYTAADNDPEYQHTINAFLSANIIENLFFITINESMQQVYEDVTLGEYEENEDLDDARNRNTFTVSPYISLQPTQRTNLTLGYSFTDTRYSLGQSNGTPSFLSLDGDQYDFRYNVNQTHNTYFSANHELNDRASLSFGGGYTRQIYDDEGSINLSRYNLYIGGKYEFSENLSADLEFGPNYSVPDIGDESFSPYVQASVNYSIGRSVFSFSYNTSFEDDLEAGETVNKSSYGINWIKNFDRSILSLGLSYNTYDSNISYRENDATEEVGNTFNPRLSYSYELTPRTKLSLSYNGTIYQNHELGEHRHTGSYGLSYELSEKSILSFTHRIQYTLPYKEEEYFANQVLLNFNYSF